MRTAFLGEWETRRTRHAHEEGASRVASTANSEDEEKAGSGLGQRETIRNCLWIWSVVHSMSSGRCQNSSERATVVVMDLPDSEK